MKIIPRPRSPQSDGYKAISYAYASSALAARLGASKTGCHVVETPDTYAGPFTTWKDAKAHADTLSGPFSKYSAPEPKPRAAQAELLTRYNIALDITTEPEEETT